MLFKECRAIWWCRSGQEKHINKMIEEFYKILVKIIVLLIIVKVWMNWQKVFVFLISNLNINRQKHYKYQIREAISLIIPLRIKLMKIKSNKDHLDYQQSMKIQREVIQCEVAIHSKLLNKINRRCLNSKLFNKIIWRYLRLMMRNGHLDTVI